MERAKVEQIPLHHASHEGSNRPTVNQYQLHKLDIISLYYLPVTSCYISISHYIFLDLPKYLRKWDKTRPEQNTVLYTCTPFHVTFTGRLEVFINLAPQLYPELPKTS